MEIQTNTGNLIRREDAVEVLQKLIDARSGRNCTNRQKMVEAAAFKYAIEIIRKVPAAE